VPENPELTIDTDNQSLDGSVSTILKFLESNEIIN
jgi:adenylylsulfate kinase-like enzyme